VKPQRIAIGCALAALLAVPAAVQAQQALPTPSPTPAASPVPMKQVAKPVAKPVLRPTPKPPPPRRIGISGVWEIQIQYPNKTIYAHFSMHQHGDALEGTYLSPAGKKARLAGSVSGENMVVVVTLPDGKVMRFESQLNGTTDMVGMLTKADGKRVVFTASYRPKEKFFDSLSPVPGGLGGVGTGTGGGIGGGGGYNPPR